MKIGRKNGTDDTTCVIVFLFRTAIRKDYNNNCRLVHSISLSALWMSAVIRQLMNQCKQQWLRSRSKSIYRSVDFRVISQRRWHNGTPSIGSIHWSAELFSGLLAIIAMCGSLARNVAVFCVTWLKWFMRTVFNVRIICLDMSCSSELTINLNDSDTIQFKI